MRRGDLKAATLGPRGPLEIFDLSADPKEQHSLLPEDPRIPATFTSAFMHMLFPSCGYPDGTRIQCTKADTNW
jgi:hypothetical protein